MRRTFAIVFLLTMISTGEAKSAQDHIVLSPDALHWQPIPREWFVGVLPPGFGSGEVAQVAIVHGDPNKAGEPFVLRIKSPKGNRVLPLHWHEFDENITVLSGVWCVGTGDKVDPNACTDMPPDCSRRG